jgi:RimJ/RimL family protein N-acetyltransferase
MDAIRLVPATRDDLEVLRDADTSMVHEWRVAPGYNEFREAMDVFVGMLDAGIAPEWATHLLVHEADATLIGLVGYKGPPVDGTVEIGYQVAPAYRGRGLATRAVQVMVDRAAAEGVALVLAHTLPGPNPSTAVLDRAGFHKAGEIANPDGGTVWRWERHLRSSEPSPGGR